MEIILLFLTAAIMAALFLVTYRIGYKDGEKHQAEASKVDVIKVNKQNQSVIKGYTDFANFNG